MFLRHVFLLFSTLWAAQAIVALSETPELCAECHKCPPKRTLFNITWNCLSTVFICAWVSVHPNVPPSDSWGALQRRLKAMLWTIIAPELVLAWAVRQWFAAWEISDLMNGSQEGLFGGFSQKIKKWSGKVNGSASEPKEWTMAHAHLLVMGGITIVDPAFQYNKSKNPNGQVLTPDKYRELISGDTSFRLPKITEAEIKDRRLSLEVDCNPSNYVVYRAVHRIQDPLRVYYKLDTSTATRGDQSDPSPLGSAITVKGVMSRFPEDLKSAATRLRTANRSVVGLMRERGLIFILVLGLVAFFYFVVFICLILGASMIIPNIVFSAAILFLLQLIKTKPITSAPSNERGLIAIDLVFALRRFRYWLTSSIGVIFGKVLDDTLTSDSIRTTLISSYFILPALFFVLLSVVICFVPFFFLLFLVSFIFTAVFSIITSSTVHPGATHVPSFYAPPTKSDSYSRMVVFAVFGIIFGGLHCIGWNFKYPTLFEQNLWRASSLAITIIPVVVAPIDYILENFKLRKGSQRIFRFALDMAMTILLFIYVPTRLSLIAQSLALLRNQPPDAFLNIDWTQYIPHIF